MIARRSHQYSFDRIRSSSLTVFLPEGVKAESDALTDEGLQTIQNFNFQVYTTLNVPAGASAFQDTINSFHGISDLISGESKTVSPRSFFE